MATQPAENSLLHLVAETVAAYVSRNTVSPTELIDVIRSVHQALGTAGMEPAKPERNPPAVAVNKSVFPDYIICLEDGKAMKSLKRHLINNYNMTPKQYRAKWNLPETYPMVAPNYAARRSELAKQMGLGKVNRAR